MRHRGEFALIDRFSRGFRRPGEGVVLGIGDDAAVLAPPPGEGTTFVLSLPVMASGPAALAVRTGPTAAAG